MFKSKFMTSLIASLLIICFLFFSCATTSQIPDKTKNISNTESSVYSEYNKSQSDDEITKKNTTKADIDKKKKSSNNKVLNILAYIIGFIIGASLVG